MADISKVGIITPQGNKILDKLNISLPVTSISALVDSVVEDYARVDVFEDTYPTMGTGFLSAFSDLVWDFNQLLDKMRTANFMGTKLVESGIITVEGAKIYQRLQDRFEVFIAENHNDITGRYYYGSPSQWGNTVDWNPSTFTEAYNDMVDSVEYLNDLLDKLREAGIIAE